MCKSALDLPLRQEHVEVSVLHVLSNHAQWVGRHTHTQQSDDVGVIQTRHNLYFLQEVVPDRRTDKGEEAFPDLFFNSKEPTTGMYFSVLQRSLMHRS